MKEKPILFSTPMVRAILEGRKTQTRRVMKRQPSEHHWEALRGYQFHHKVFECHDCYAVKFWHSIPRGTMEARASDDDCWVRATYQPGDTLWVRESHYRWTGCGEAPESFTRDRCFDDHPEIENMNRACALVRVPSIHMPRWASRLTLTVTDVRVQRVQDISEEDALAEGCEAGYGPDALTHISTMRTARERFEALWDSINRKRGYSWGSNPWVWVYTFQRAETSA